LLRTCDASHPLPIAATQGDEHLRRPDQTCNVITPPPKDPVNLSLNHREKSRHRSGGYSSQHRGMSRTANEPSPLLAAEPSPKHPIPPRSRFAMRNPNHHHPPWHDCDQPMSPLRGTVPPIPTTRWKRAKQNPVSGNKPWTDLV
jgi:hypothetical protein